jgi:hypothetical protein
VKNNTHSVIRGHATSAVIARSETKNNLGFCRFLQDRTLLSDARTDVFGESPCLAKLNAAKENEIRLFIVPKGE